MYTRLLKCTQSTNKQTEKRWTWQHLVNMHIYNS
nr:MAG TPA: hypothetical protein [Caudoviricetes sp.]DAV56873.1 MAG TPA: hypothetical protein [Caudoviricetes sp.]